VTGDASLFPIWKQHRARGAPFNFSIQNLFDRKAV
jgi:hypothetical protein